MHRRHHLPRHGTDGSQLTWDDGMDGNAACLGPGRDPQMFLGRFVEWPDVELADCAMAEYAGQTLDMVGVEVRQQDERQPANTEFAQAPVDSHWVGTRVEEHGFSRSGAHRDSVALTDIADNHRPVARRPLRRDHMNRGDTHDDAGKHRRRWPPRCLTSRHNDRGHDDTQQCH